LSNSDAPQDTPRTAHAASKPSLMEDSRGPAATAPTRDKNTRMLIELESSNGAQRRGSTRGVMMLIGLGALIVAAAAGAWWSHQQAPTARNPGLDSRGVASKSAAPTPTPEAKVALVSKAASQPASSASGAVDVAPTAARIETVTSAAAAPVVAAATTLALASAASTALKANPAEATAPAKARVARPQKSTKTSQTAKNSKQQKQTKQQLAKAKKSQSPAAAPTRVANAAVAAGRGGEPGANVGNKDPDILLLTALLAHVSRDAQGAPAGSQAQLTIAQIVQRCEARGGKDSLEAAECRRRICDGYWGKAQACPANLAPKKE
jgi:hypothetical protein